MTQIAKGRETVERVFLLPITINLALWIKPNVCIFSNPTPRHTYSWYIWQPASPLVLYVSITELIAWVWSPRKQAFFFPYKDCPIYFRQGLDICGNKHDSLVLLQFIVILIIDLFKALKKSWRNSQHEERSRKTKVLVKTLSWDSCVKA